METFRPPSSDSWPPGTVRLDNVSSQDHHHIRQPIPSDDPDEPLNWSKARKCLNFGIVLFYSLMAFVLLDIGTVIWGNLNEELGISYQNLNNSFAANCAGLAIGCIFFIPYTLKYGRRPIYLLSCILMFASAIWQAEMNTTLDLILSNIFSGLGGAVSETIVQMTISDLFFVHQRATMNGLYLLMVTAGTFLAPVVAGVSAVNQGWRWIWWWTAILLGVNFIFFVFGYEESKHISALQSQALEQPPADAPTASSSPDDERKQVDGKATDLSPTRTPSPSPAAESPWPFPRKTLRQRFALATPTPGDTTTVWQIARRFLVLFRFPAMAWTALLYASLLAWFSVVLTTLSTYFTLPPYGFNASQIGLLNLPPFVGSMVGIVWAGPLNDWVILRMARRNRGVFEPEMRLWMALPGVLTTPASLWLYGFALVDGKPWIVPCIGTALFGFSFGIMGTISLTYLTDCYRELIGDALVGVAFMRNAFATIIVFALTPWIEGIGLRNMFVSVGCLSFGICLTTVAMLVYGKKMRMATKDKYCRMARL